VDSDVDDCDDDGEELLLLALDSDVDDCDDGFACVLELELLDDDGEEDDEFDTVDDELTDVLSLDSLVLL